MPSTTSSSLSRPEPSSTVITPSLPTFSIASAMVLPIDSSEFAEIVPTCAMALLSLQGLESFFSSSVAAMTALSMPRLMSIGLRPEETALRPSRMMACASTVAVVVPSPASSEVLEATSFTSCAPMFSNLSLSSISLATDTPSLVIVGRAEALLEHGIATLGAQRRLDGVGQDVDAAEHLHARVVTKTYFFSSHDYLPSMTAMTSSSRMTRSSSPSTFTSVPPYLPNRILSPTLRSSGRTDAVFQNLSLAHRDDLALDGLFGRGVRDDDSASRRTFFLEPLHDDAVVEGANLHDCHSFKSRY